MNLGSLFEFPILCDDCESEIDPYVCWCGSTIYFGAEESMNMWSHSGHSIIPMGCDCGREDMKDNEHFRLGRAWADTGTLAIIPKKYRVEPTTNEASSLAIAVAASIKAMLTALEEKNTAR